MRKDRKFYVLVMAVMPLAMATAIFAWLDGNIRSTAVTSGFYVIWSFGLIMEARKISRYRKANRIYHAIENIKIRRRMIVGEIIFWVLMFMAATAGLITIALFRSRPLYVLLETILLMVVSGGHLLFARCLEDE